MRHLMFVGKMASGKTTMAKIMCEEFGYKRISLADPIKSVLYGLHRGENVYELVEEHIFPFVELSAEQQTRVVELAKESMDIDDAGPKYRKQLQFFGTDGCRNQVASDIWIRVLYGRVDAAPLKQNFAVDDCRFVNEYTELLDLFRPVILYISPAEQQKRMRELYGEFDPSVLTHASETEFELIQALAKQDPTHLEINSNLSLEHNRQYLISLFKE